MDWLVTIVVGVTCFTAGLVVDRVLAKKKPRIRISIGSIVMFLLGIAVGYFFSPYISKSIEALGGLIAFFIILLLIIIAVILLFILETMLKAGKIMRKLGLQNL